MDLRIEEGGNEILMCLKSESLGMSDKSQTNFVAKFNAFH